MNIVLAATGTHNFLAEAGSTITQSATSIITGTGALTANGAGTVTLGGANTYSGGTNVTAGMLTVAANSALGTGSVTLGTATTLTINAGRDDHQHDRHHPDPGQCHHQHRQPARRGEHGSRTR